MSCGLFSCKGNGLTMYSTEKKQHRTVWIAIATSQTSAKFLYKPHPFYHQFLKIVPCENNNKKHEQYYWYVSTATPYRMKDTHFCYYRNSNNNNNNKVHY